MSSGNKYHRDFQTLQNGKIDVYCVIDAFGVTCPACQHAIKKLLCAGLRGKNDRINDLKEAIDAVERAVELEEKRSDYTKTLSVPKRDVTIELGPVDLGRSLSELGADRK